MTAAGWEPTNDLERVLADARSRRDEDTFLAALTHADLVLPTPDDGDVMLADVSGRRCVLAFTSDTAMRHVLGSEPTWRPVRFVELGRGWPDPVLWLAIDPGLPVEGLFTPVAVGDIAEVAGRPATELERDLASATAAMNVEAAARALLPAEVLVPLDPSGSQSRDITDPDFPWLRLTDESRPITIFTSPTRLREELGELDAVEVAFAALMAQWPDPTAGLAVNPGTSFECTLAAPSTAAIAQRVRAIAESVLVEVVVPAGITDRYLRHNHNRVAGLIHRIPSARMPLADLYLQLGLLGDGSPFGAEDEVGYVIRWYEPDRDAYRAPTMDGVDLTPGAALWRVERDGAESCVAFYALDTAGVARWTGTGD